MDITNKFTNKNSEKVKIQLDLNASASEEETLSDHYVILRSLGKGDFAEVKLAYHLHTEVQVAVKVLENGTKNEFSRKTKIDMYNTLNHPYIIKLFHIINNKEYIYVVLEHAAGGDLVSYTGRMGSLQEEQAQHIFTQLVCAVHYCHDNGIAHRDIKLDNILLDAKGNNKLCDFGLATRVTPGQGTKGFCGTLEYCAPEFFSGKEYDAKAVDIWSMGVFLYTMVTASFPFKANTYSDMKEEMLDPKYHLPYTLSQNIANILVQLFTVKPEHRPKIFDMRQHQWLKTKEKFGKITPSLQALWNNLNPCIVVAMGRMDYHPKDISACLREKKFNNIMAIYLILNHKSPCDLYKYAAKFLPARVTMSPADALTSFPTQRGLSEPALLNLLEEHQMHDEKGSRKKRMSIPPACAASIWETNILPQPPNLLEVNTPNNSSNTQSSGSYREVRHNLNTTATYDIQRVSLKTTSKDSYGDIPPEGIPKIQRYSLQATSKKSIEFVAPEGIPEIWRSSGSEKSKNSFEDVPSEETTAIQKSSIQETSNNSFHDVPPEDIDAIPRSSLQQSSQKSFNNVLLDGIPQIQRCHISDDVLSKHICEIPRSFPQETLNNSCNDVPSEEIPEIQRSSLLATSKNSFEDGPPRDVSAASESRLSRAWKRVKKRIGNCLRRLCCCVPASKRSHFSHKEVEPVEMESSTVKQMQLHGVP
ncbi:sperm motility kinase 2B-like [Cricetulus griseus]|uniref:non-specific serine/threonine protein kinase n=1 Tax=Cricetulus griseus TaxID=10029 RepID=A0A9J7GRC1_CRIGR|nr:sperm motility kinase 2B-like [Cricetulus griseus]XP_027289815.1 sperm motility kinase 2B-like [Cricetulus griseus]